jgi:hypothetical protein
LLNSIWVSDSVGLKWGPIICFSNQFSSWSCWSLVYTLRSTAVSVTGENSDSRYLVSKAGHWIPLASYPFMYTTLCITFTYLL